jgi:hypothetical protein
VTIPPRPAFSVPFALVTRSATFQRRGSEQRAASGQCLLVSVIKGEALELDNASGFFASTIDDSGIANE